MPVADGEEGRRTADMIVVRGQEGKAKAEMRTCDEHVVPACTKFPVSKYGSASHPVMTLRVSAHALG